MNDFAKRWVAALRSGEYQQTRGTLRDDNGFCCLGVACDLYYGRDRWESRNGLGYFISDMCTSLPDDVRRALGLRDVEGNYSHGSLMLLNDEGATFSEIVDIIESEPKGLFA